jgi:hemoglobin
MKRDILNEEGIIQLVDSFYDRVRATPGLKEIFEQKIGQDDTSWKPHLQRMYAFWSSLMLRSGVYYGNPVKVHQALPYFPPELFEVWLDLFKETSESIFCEEISSRFVAKSEMIAKTFKAALYTERD